MIEGFPEATVAGHFGELVFGLLGIIFNIIVIIINIYQ
jgi:hypothetical protein